MIKYYGNQIWNNSTRNSDKQIIYIPATKLQTVINSLDTVGLNYYAYIRSEDKNARLAINKNDLELFKRIDTQERYSEAPRFDREVKAIIGNTAYRDIKNKSYVSYNTDFALKLAEMFTRQGIPFSGRIRRTRDDNSLTTLTFDEKHRNQTELLASQLKAQRAMLNSAENLYISGNANINALSDVKGKWLVMPVDEFKAVERNLIDNSISYSAVANSKGIMLYYSAVDESRVLDAVSQNNIREISMKLNSILTTLSLRSSEQLEALQPAVELFLEKYDDETFVDVFSEAFADTSSFSSEQLNEIARKFADEYKNFSGVELLLVPSDIPALKDKFNKEAMLSELTSERGYTEQQIAEIKKLIDNNVSQSILELIDYTFSPEQIGRVGTAQSYSDILEVVAEAKHTSAHNIGNYIRLGTYMRETPLDDKDGSDFNQATITLSDISALQSIGGRKSVLNLSKTEISNLSNWSDYFYSTIDRKSPFYRNVNGDWRENDESMENILSIESRNVDFKSVRDDIKSQTIVRGSFVNEDTGWKIQVSRNGLEDSVKYAFKHMDSVTYDILYHIDKIIKHSVFLDSTVSERNNNHKAFNSAFMHKFYMICKIDKQPYLVKTTVEEFFDGKDSTLKRIYNVQDIKIEPLRLIEFTDKPLARSVLNDSKISVSNIFNIVKNFDSDFYTNKNQIEFETGKAVRPTITCEWSEHPVFEDGKTYSVSEFDRMMKKADSEWCENRQKEIDTYGDIDKIFEAYEKGEIDGVHQGYAKTKFTVNMPDGRKITERQDIGDGDGGVIDFLKQTPHHREIVRLLQADIESESHNTEATSELTDTAHQDKVSSADNRSYSSTMQQYFKIKEENPDKIVLLRVGDFYEAMGNDAIVVSQTLDLHMTKRRLNDNERIDMCGFPVHSFEQYKNRLLSAGHSIEILDEVRESVERKINATETVKLDPNTMPIGNDDYYFHRPDVGEFEAVYYNPDATAGGQFVFMHLPYELISKAKDNSTGANEFYEYLDEHAKTDLVDLGTPEYDEVLKNYAEPHPDLLGRTEDTMNSLVSKSVYGLNKLQSSGKNEVIDNIKAEDNKPFFEEHIIVPNKEKYSITERADSEYHYDVKQLISVDGGNSYYYAENGKYCKTLEEARDFVKSKLSEKIVDDLKVGALIRIDNSVWKITKIDGDFSIYLENTDKSANEQVRSHLGHWKKHLIESGFEYVTTQSLSDVTEKPDTDLQTGQQADDIAFADKTFAEQVDATINGTMPFYSSLKVCDTPQILIDLGCRQLPMLYTQRHLLDALHKKSKKNPHWHGLSVEQIKKMPALLQEPAIVFDSLTRNDSVMLVLPETDNDNLPLIVSVKPNGQGRYHLEQVDSNFITSIYGKDKFAKYLETIIKNEKLLFIDKAKSQNLFERWGLQLPELTKGFDFDIIIHQSSNIVNERLSEDREKSQNLFERWGEQYSELTKGSDSDIIMHQSSNIVNEKLSEDREKSQALFSVPGLQLSKGLNNLDSDIIMHQSSNIVNERLSENAEKAPKLAEKALQENEIESAPGSINNLFELAEQSPDKPQDKISSIDEYALDSNNDDTNFVITDDNTVSGAKTKFRNNINAIKTLRVLELNGKAATNADKKALSLYTGWGGLAPAFSENPTWKNEAQELRNLLTADEYVSARASTLDAFYTDNTIIDGIYQALKNFGFTGGDVLEPAMGIGNFFGRMPSDISRSSHLYGVEKDSISGRIASKLYPDASITVDGFENTQFQNGSFDVAVGNIPFGDFSVNDKEYNSQHLKIHDYFFLKTLDKVRPGGIVAFVTSKGTLDKKDTSFRKSLSERADLLGAVRLPNNAFKSAGTEVTSDIIFLQKRTAPPENLPEWVQLGATSDGLSVNQYFASHPDMVLGKIVQGNKMYGRNDDTMCIPFDDADLSRLLPEAINKISGSYTPDFDKPSPLQDIKNQDVVLPENIRQESYFVHNGELYFWGVAGRDVEITHARELWSNYSTKNRKYNNKNIERTKAFVELREIVRELLEVQKLPGDYSKRISELQKALNEKYDAFYSKFGLLHAQQNRLLLSRDSAYPLLLSLEAEVDKGKLVRKSDIFTERTISPPIAVEHVDTALEALNVSIVSLGKIDLDYMSELCDIPKRVIIEQLRGQIYPVPELSTDDNTVYQTASEYLSGDIYKKLDTAKAAAEANPLFEDNIPALKDAIPAPLKSGDIDVNIGATWIEPKYYQQFIYEVFLTPNEYRADIKPRFIWQRVGKKIEVEYSTYSNKWQITNKSLDKSVTVTKQLGTQFKSAYSIFESVLNLNDPRVYKDAVDKNGNIIFDKSGNPVRVLDVERTKLLQQKANIIKRKFKDWIFKDPQRRSELVAKYNREFNCIKPREFDGSHLTFPGMNSSIELRSHQKNAIAHAIFGGNTLFAHSVGAGKTFEMIATAMECKRLGFCHKSLFAVPNHLTEQIGADFLKLYPGANILVATAKDFTKANRKQLMSKIATGNYDAVIIGHSQLKNLPLSPEIQKKIYREQIDDIIAGIAELKESNGSSFQVKAMERTRKSLQSKLDSLDTQNRDNTVYFDELGIDKLFIDEAHEFKNLFSATKLQNISGISSRASQRATDLFAKCRYLDEKTGGKGVVFATGTPVSNSITEMHTMMRYLQYDFLASHNNMQNFDNWVSTFGKIKVDYELAPAGNKFKERSRVAEYSNMPELMSMFKQVADIRPADTLHLAVPECSLHIVNTKPTDLQQSLVAELSARADDVNAGKVDPSVDNMLKITGDGRKVGLDPRLINPDFEDNPETKLNRCVANVLDIYNETASSKLTQLIFCDLGVPKKDNSLSDSDSADDTLSVSEMDSLEESGAFSVYQDIKDKLIASGVPEKEIAFIHDAHTEAQKAELFYKVRNGDVRILLGSTAKMGTGTNVQNRLVALHDLDVPWRPSDLEQRRGRMVRQGNINKHVDLYRYVTEGTFDAYSYQLLEKKQRFIGQIMTSKTPARRCSDIDQEALSYSEIKALCTGDERIKEKLTLENRVKELEVYRKDYINNKYELEDKVAAYPAESEKIKTKIEHISRDIEMLKNAPRDKDKSIIFSIKIGDKTYTERADAAKALAVACKCVKGDSNRGKTFRIGEMCGFPIELKLDKFFDSISATLVGNERYTVTFSDTMLGNLRKLENGLAHLPKLLEEEKFELNKLDFDFESAQELLKKPFEFEDEYQEKTLRLERVTEELNAEARELIKNGVPKERTNLFGKKSILSQSKSASKDVQNKRLNNSKKNEGYSL